MLKVFLVEDETVIREGLQEKIPWEQYGFRLAGTAGDGEMALPLIRKTRPDVLITDIKMPFMDGLELSRIVHTEFPKAKIIVISGYDDFEYARSAIEVGVDQYLLKPITRSAIRTALLDMKERIEQERAQEDYQIKFRNEMREYEQFSRRRFFEKLLEGKLSATEIYEEAAKHSIEIDASCYNLIVFYLQETKNREQAGRQEEVLHYFLRHPQYILFPLHIGYYGVLIESDSRNMEGLADRGVAHIQSVFGEGAEWYAAVGEPVERLSMLSACYKELNHYFAYRFLIPDKHVFTKETLKEDFQMPGGDDVAEIDSAKVDPELIRRFLARGGKGEIDEFAESYIESMGSAVKSRLFLNYLVLSIRFTALSYVGSIGRKQEEFLERVGKYGQDIQIRTEELEDYFVNMLRAAIELRDAEDSSQGRKLLRRALDYIDDNYDKETISLNTAAEEVNVSASYLSAVFSQNMKKTFVEYITEKRMEKARKLLRETSYSSGEIARMAGYKDTHYFSFVFRKTQGQSPREYRNSNKY